MTTAQESNGHLPQKGYPLPAKVYQQDELSPADEVALFAGDKVSPPPSSAGNPAECNSADLPANQDHDKPFPAGAYHVPPNIYVPKAHAYRSGDSLDRPHLDGPLPDRCQFMFSDGRQCQMARSDIHPSLCVYHSEREEQLFGEPSAKGLLRGPSYDLPELFSAARDLSTAASVNRVLAQVFRLLAQRRISRQEAATFAHLAKLLLRTISLMAAEAEVRPEPPSRPPAEVTNGMSFRRSTKSNWSEGPLIDPLTPDESWPENARSRVPTEGVIPQTSSPISAPTFADRAEIGRSGEDEESRAGSPTHAASACAGVQSQRRNGVQQGPTSGRLVPDAPAAAITSQRINTSAPPVRNSPEISTYKNTVLKPHLESALAENEYERRNPQAQV